MNINHKFGNVYEASITIPHGMHTQESRLTKRMISFLQKQGYKVAEHQTFRISTEPNDVSLAKKFTLIK